MPAYTHGNPPRIRTTNINSSVHYVKDNEKIKEIIDFAKSKGCQVGILESPDELSTQVILTIKYRMEML